MIHEVSPPIRYSPKPLSEYTSLEESGPAKDRRVDREAIWNLAYLSHDYDKQLMHKDPHFLTHVRRTCQFDYQLGRPDLTFDSEHMIGRHLLMPAPWFIKWLSNHKQLVPKLPMYEAYGPAWLYTIESRARTCHAHDEVDESPIRDTGAAVIELRRFMRR